jgi:hypothetical protein
MSRLHIDVAVQTALAQRDDMIDMEVSLDELSADAATTAVYLIDDLGIYVLDELT